MTRKKIEAPFVRNPYNYDTNAASDESGLYCPEPTLTQQSFAEEVDINFIADRYGLTGELPQVVNLPSYGDFSGIFDFQTAQNAVRQALEQFMTLPAKMRSRFNNNPQQLLAFLEDPDNRDEAIFMGLIKRPEEPIQSPQSHAAPERPKDEGLPKPAPKGAPEGSTKPPETPKT